MQQAFEQLDQVELDQVFGRKAIVLQAVPYFMRGPARNAYRTALQALRAPQRKDPNGPDATRAWKLFLLVSRLLLFRAPGQKQVPKEDFARRASMFQDGRWIDLLAESNASTEANRPRSSASTTHAEVGLERRAARAHTLVRLGEVSAARQALVSEAVAPGNATTLRELSDPNRRPQVPHEPIEPETMEFQPEEPFVLDRGRFVTNLRRARAASRNCERGRRVAAVT